MDLNDTDDENSYLQERMPKKVHDERTTYRKDFGYDRYNSNGRTNQRREYPGNRRDFDRYHDRGRSPGRKIDYDREYNYRTYHTSHDRYDYHKPSQVGCQYCGEMYHDVMTCPKRQKGSCFNCGSLDHKVPFCPNKKSTSERARQSGCINCGSLEHKMSLCPTKKSTSERARQSGCFTCGNLNHQKWECPVKDKIMYVHGFPIYYTEIDMLQIHPALKEVVGIRFDWRIINNGQAEGNCVLVFKNYNDRDKAYSACTEKKVYLDESRVRFIKG